MHAFIDDRLDKGSRELHVKCAVYNGNLEVFTYMDLSFIFGEGGGLIRPHQVKIQVRER